MQQLQGAGAQVVVLHTEVMMGGRLNGGNFAGVATRARSRGRLWEMASISRPHLSATAMQSGRQAGLARRDLPRRCRPARRKNSSDPFSI
jgi:hypothetical protein